MTEKGKGLQRKYLEERGKGPRTETQQRRADRFARSGWYWKQEHADEDAHPRDHQVEVPWPLSYADMGRETMLFWEEEAAQEGLRLRLSSWRDRVYRNNPALAAAFYRLLLTGKKDDPDAQQKANAIIVDMIGELQQRSVPVSLPWNHIVSNWKWGLEEDSTETCHSWNVMIRARSLEDVGHDISEYVKDMLPSRTLGHQ